jgi:hypothetical protein
MRDRTGITQDDKAAWALAPIVFWNPQDSNKFFNPPNTGHLPPSSRVSRDQWKCVAQYEILGSVSETVIEVLRSEKPNVIHGFSQDGNRVKLWRKKKPRRVAA